jgi:TPR repeat protein
MTHKHSPHFEHARTAFDEGKFPEALHELKVLAQHNNPDAQNLLGFMYDAGMGTKKNTKKAIALYRMAAEQGNLIAQTNLALMCDFGRGPEKAIEKH